MPFCDNDGVKIHYEVEGSGPEVVMIHGFAADLEINWRLPGVADALKTENRLVMMDCRGHGKSDKPKDPSMYGARMLGDITALMDHLGIERANFLGYSMGSHLCLNLLLTQPERFKSVILGGFVLPNRGQEDFSTERHDTVAKALLADSLEEVADPVAREFRRFAESTGGDLKALAAVMAAWTENEDAQLSDTKTLADRIRAISIPLMTILGNDDFLPGDKSRLSMLVPDGCHFIIQGKDHLTVVPDPKFRMAVKAFLNYVNAR